MIKNSEYKTSNRIKLILTEISIVLFLCSVLWFILQVLIIAGIYYMFLNVSRIVFYWLLGILSVVTGIYILLDIIKPIKFLQDRLYGFIRKHKWMFRIVNIFAGLLTCILLVNTFLVLLFGRVEDKIPAEVTVLYDSNIMNEFIVKETILPVILKEKTKGRKVSVMPINDNNIEKSLLFSKFLIVFSHGWNGAVYANNPPKEYGSDKFSRPDSCNLKLAYFSSCYLGVGGYREQWNKVFDPAKIILFDRESAVIEHIFWMLFNAGKEIDMVMDTSN